MNRPRSMHAILAATAILVGGCFGGGAASPSPFPSRGAVASPSPPGATTVANPTLVASPTRSPIPTATLGMTPTSDAACVLPTSVADLGVYFPVVDHLVSCLGNRDIVLTGYLAPAWGVGGQSSGVVPTWLGEWSGLGAVLWLKPHPADGCFEDDDCVWIFLHAPNPTALQLSPDRWVSLTGHLDDPLASTCRIDGSGTVQTDAEAIAVCRRSFVVTELHTVDPPS